VEEAIRKASVLIEALPYVQAFRDKVVVVKFGGSAMESDAAMTSVLQDVVFMELAGMHPILVHGGGPFITKEMARRGKQPRFVEGHRVTDEETLEIATDVLVNQVNAAIVKRANELGGRAVSSWYACNGLIQAQKQFMELPDASGGKRQIDIGFVGKVTAVNGPALMGLCWANRVPVVPPIGTGANGENYNVQADTVAAAIAMELKAEKLVFLSNTHGIMTNPPDEASFASTLNAEQVNDLIKRKVITEGMLPKARACLASISAGVGKAHIIDGRIPHSLLLEIFTDKGIGTQIVL